LFLNPADTQERLKSLHLSQITHQASAYLCFLWHEAARSISSGGSKGGALGARAPHLFWVKKKEITDGKKASRTRKSRPGPSP